MYCRFYCLWKEVGLPFMIFSLCHVFLYFFAFIADEGVLSGDFMKNGDDVLKLLVEWSLRTVVQRRQRPTFIHVIRLVTMGTLMSQEVFVTKCEINCLKALLGLEGNLLLSNSASLFFGALRGKLTRQMFLHCH